jgi:hypothetical protein
MMKPDSAVCIEVPNDFSVIQEVLHTELGYPSWWVAPPEHLNYFSQDTLGSLLNQRDFTELSWSTQFPIDMLLLAGIDYVSDKSLGRLSHKARVRFEMSLQSSGKRQLLSNLYASLVGLGLGRELIAVGIRGAE